jgi:hypothetical protein
MDSAEVRTNSSWKQLFQTYWFFLTRGYKGTVISRRIITVWEALKHFSSCISGVISHWLPQETNSEISGS